MKVTKRRSLFLVNGCLFLIVALWTIPIIGLLVSSIRQPDNISRSGWWTVLPHQEQVTSEEREIPKDQKSDQQNRADGGLVGHQVNDIVEVINDRNRRWASRS